MTTIAARIRHWRSECRGTVSVELALVLPMMFTLLSGGVEMVNYVLIHQKLERTSATMADLISQSARLTEQQMRTLFIAVDDVMQPYDLNADGNATVSSITGRGGVARIDWQRSTGTGSNASELGRQGDAATLPAGLTVPDGDNVIICEAWFDFQPVLFTGVVSEQVIYRTAVFRPRFGKLDVIYP